MARSLLTFCRVTESKSQRSAFPRPKLKGPEQTQVGFIFDSSLSLLLQCFPDLANNIVTFFVRIWQRSTYLLSVICYLLSVICYLSPLRSADRPPIPSLAAYSGAYGCILLLRRQWPRQRPRQGTGPAPRRTAGQTRRTAAPAPPFPAPRRQSSPKPAL